MSEIELRQDHVPVLDTDSWVTVVQQVATLAQQIAQTPFVPESFRGSVPAVAAAILTGREMGLPPMVSLRHIHVIKGKPGQSAELMRALVQRAGHEIKVTEATDTRAVVRGRRRGEVEWQEARFTAEQARRAKIDLGGYPEDKLVARATTRLCRRHFADAIGGMPSVDELEDVGAEDAVPVGAPETTGPAKSGRSVRRATAVRQLPTAQSEPPQIQPAPEPEAPPLPGEEDESLADPAPETVDPSWSITRPQSRRLHATFTDLGVTERTQRLRVASAVVGRQVESSNELTVAEASLLIDTLAELAALPEPQDALEGLLGGPAEAPVGGAA